MPPHSRERLVRCANWHTVASARPVAFDHSIILTRMMQERFGYDLVFSLKRIENAQNKGCKMSANPAVRFLGKCSGCCLQGNAICPIQERFCCRGSDIPRCVG